MVVYGGLVVRFLMPFADVLGKVIMGFYWSFLGNLVVFS
nr:MAG TPA: hypothetical protein [Bacteriophage sp.]DAV71216.1 MAG TPA: hypothetical protein [Bacteriophage sp.]